MAQAPEPSPKLDPGCDGRFEAERRQPTWILTVHMDGIGGDKAKKRWTYLFGLPSLHRPVSIVHRTSGKAEEKASSYEILALRSKRLQYASTRLLERSRSSPDRVTRTTGRLPALQLKVPFASKFSSSVELLRPIQSTMPNHNRLLPREWPIFAYASGQTRTVDLHTRRQRLPLLLAMLGG